jgi:hypothetical protein
MIWGNIAVAIEALEGKQGTDDKKKISQTCFVFESQDVIGSKWYRVYRKFSTGNLAHGDIEVNILWHESVNFLPVFHMITDESDNTRNLIQVRWEKSDDQYFPAESYSVIYEKPGVLSFRRRITTQKIAINQGVGTEHFFFLSLGLGDGDILVDRVKQSVYTMKNDKPVYLAKFYEKYRTPEEQASRFRFVTMGLGILLIIIGLYLRYMRIRKRKLQK